MSRHVVLNDLLKIANKTNVMMNWFRNLLIVSNFRNVIFLTV